MESLKISAFYQMLSGVRNYEDWYTLAEDKKIRLYFRQETWEEGPEVGGTDCPFDHFPAHHVDRSKLLENPVPVVPSSGSLQDISTNNSFKFSGKYWFRSRVPW
jgi:hypothetical protein